MSKKYWAVTSALGCVTMLLAVAVVAIPLFVVPLQIRAALRDAALQPAAQAVAVQASQNTAVAAGGSLTALYQRSNPGIVSVRVAVRGRNATGEGAGSGFVYDDRGHIITNHHVVDGATRVSVVFADGTEAEAAITGKDPDSDLAVIKVDRLPQGAHQLPLGDSDQVAVGETVIAIGNPFALGNSMTMGIVSAVGRTIDSGATPFSIPLAIQTDAAINPGNSGGPLLNLKGEVIGVNAQIATSGVQANAGVGFAIPANIVRAVAPVLVEKGSYTWPWLGVRGGSVNLALMQANGLDAQQGAYIDEVDPAGPAIKAGLQGSSGTTSLDGIEVPVGGDVIVAVDGKPVTSFDALMVEIATRQPGDQVVLTIVRDRQRQQVNAALAPRPGNTTDS